MLLESFWYYKLFGTSLCQKSTQTAAHLSFPIAVMFSPASILGTRCRITHHARLMQCFAAHHENKTKKVKLFTANANKGFLLKTEESERVLLKDCNGNLIRTWEGRKRMKEEKKFALLPTTISLDTFSGAENCI